MSAFGSLFSSRYLTYDPNGIPGVFFGIYTGLLAVGMLLSIYTYLKRRPLSQGVTPRRHLLRNTAQSFMWICGLGLFLALMRYLQVLYLDLRIFSYLLVLGAIAYCGYLTFYLSERYPISLYHFQQTEVDRRYRIMAKRRAQPAAAPAGRSGIARGKRRK